ncbi:MAG: type II toxin-antitoxin system RelE/ParE family toxin [Roseiflexaceae bacterium]|nr:type II toxin-antitoxin system RelE/ParE family toxin [Roseiflexaceae bacterium]
MRVIFAPDALRELSNHLRYVQARNPDAALDQQRIISTAIDQLEDLPHLGRHGRLPGTRELVMSGTPYIAVYEVTPSEEVRILHVYHGRQNWTGEAEAE